MDQQKAKDATTAVAQAASKTIDHHRDAVADMLEDAATAIQRSTARRPVPPVVDDLAESASERMATTARYVREHDSSEMVTDLTGFVRSHAGACVLIAAAVGVLVGRGLPRG